MKIKLEKGFKQFLVKTVIFVVLFALMQIVTVKFSSQTRLPPELTPFYLVDIAKAGLFIAVLFFITYRERLLKIEKSKFEPYSLFLGIPSIALVFLYFWLKKALLTNIESALSYSVLFATLLYFILFLMVFFLVLAIYGVKFCKKFYRDFKKEIGLFLLVFAIIYFVSDKIQDLWYVFSGLATKIVYFLLTLSFEPTMSLRGELPIIGLGEFIVGIDKPCSGIESIFLFSFLYIFAVCFDWKLLSKKKAIFLFFPGVISVFLLNVLRIYLMILIGAFISQDLALGLFHTNIGWILFLTYFAIFWLVFYKWMKK